MTVVAPTETTVSATPLPEMSDCGRCCHEIPQSFRSDMRTGARIFADAELLHEMGGEAVTQLVNVTTLPGIVDYACGMPDMHEGYGFPVGGVAATLLPDGVVSPGGVGFDINCGVRLISTPLTRGELGDRHEALTHEISRSIPSGMGHHGRWKLANAELDGVLALGSSFLVREKGYGLEDDLEHTESNGRIGEADASAVSSRARERGRSQLGTIGAGNHFIEIQKVDEIFDSSVAAAFGLTVDQIVILVHTGSRGLGHQVCTDYVRMFDSHLGHFGITLPDRQLSCAPASSIEGQNYFKAMSAAANFAWANRQMVTHRLREVLQRMFPEIAGDKVRVIYDVAHNIAKRETHGGRELCVHRKGATRAFGPAHPDLPSDYRDVGQPVFIPGSMGTSTYVLTGTHQSENRAFGSACHGAGRRMSRGSAKRQTTGAAVRKQLEARGIAVRCPTSSGLAEEMPLAYKDVDRVAAVVEEAGLARRVARLIPIGVVKG